MPDKTHGKEISLGQERCFLCGVVTPGLHAEGEDPLEELARLVDTAGGREAGRLVQRQERPNAKTYFGKGKLEELAAAVREVDADTVVVDDALQPKQLSAIEEACERKVIDRCEVILDIFQARARSRQAKLQVELAQAKYELPRLARKWTHLERLGGGIGTRGPGESQIETDRRLLRRRIGVLQRDLDAIEARRGRELGARADVFSVCLVGYTNAGKSSLLNRLTRAEAFVEDRLFATLDTLTRRLDLSDGREILLSDTVGFIRRLPHHLVASFHATLLEAITADLLLLVVDASDPFAFAQAASAEATLAELGMGDKERLYLLNKADRATNTGSLSGLVEALKPSFVVSAKTGQGVDLLLAELRRRAGQGRKRVCLAFSAGDGRRFALANEWGHGIAVRYDGELALVTGWFADEALSRLRALPGTMKETAAAE